MEHRLFVITGKDLAFIEEAIHVLRDHVQARGCHTEASLNQTRSVLAGLLMIYPRPEPTWQPDGAA